MRKGLTGTVVLALVVASLTLIGGAPLVRSWRRARWPMAGLRQMARGGGPPGRHPRQRPGRCGGLAEPRHGSSRTTARRAGTSRTSIAGMGTRWSEVPFPTPRHERDHPYWALTAIETIAPHEVWAVGYRGLDRSQSRSAPDGTERAGGGPDRSLGPPGWPRGADRDPRHGPALGRRVGTSTTARAQVGRRILALDPHAPPRWPDHLHGRGRDGRRGHVGRRQRRRASEPRPRVPMGRRRVDRSTRTAG